MKLALIQKRTGAHAVTAFSGKTGNTHTVLCWAFRICFVILNFNVLVKLKRKCYKRPVPYLINVSKRHTCIRHCLLQITCGIQTWSMTIRLRNMLYIYIYWLNVKLQLSQGISEWMCSFCFLNSCSGLMEGWVGGWEVGWVCGRNDGHIHTYMHVKCLRPF